MTPEERAAFEERRRGMIGGSDCGAIMQVEGCRDIMDVWRSKVDPDFKKPHLAVYDAGNELEPLIIGKFQKEKGLILCDHQKYISHPSYDFIACHVDAMVKFTDGNCVLEAKSAAFKSEDWGKAGTQQVPMDIFFQAHHNMMCSDAIKCFIPVLFRAEWLFEIFIVNRDPSLDKIILNTEVKFWNDHVLTKIPPVVEENRISIRDSSIAATSDIVDDICEYRSVSSQLRTLEAKKKVLRSKLNQFIGAYEKVTYDGKTLATYKSFERSTFDKEKFYVEHPELAEKYTKKAMYSQLRVK